MRECRRPAEVTAPRILVAGEYRFGGDPFFPEQPLMEA
jgi:hypothetical protein